MGKIHIVALLIFVSHVSCSMDHVFVDKDFGLTEVDGIDTYECLSYTFPTFVELLLDVCTMIKLFIILVCIITTWIDLFIKMPDASVMYVIQSMLGVLQMLVQESQDLFAPAIAILIMVQETVLDHYYHKGYISVCKHSQNY